MNLSQRTYIQEKKPKRGPGEKSLKNNDLLALPRMSLRLNSYNTGCKATNSEQVSLVDLIGIVARCGDIVLIKPAVS